MRALSTESSKFKCAKTAEEAPLKVKVKVAVAVTVAVWKEKDRDLPEPVKLHQPHLISGTVALADITEQTRVYHYTID